jgi:hypothetical protein
MATDLEDLLRDPKLMPLEQVRLARALAVVYGHLGPAERAAHSKTILVSHANTTLAALRDPRNNLNMLTLAQSVELLAALCVLLDRQEAGRVFDALLTILSDPPATQRFARPTQRFRLDLMAGSIRDFSSRLDEVDLRRLLDNTLVVGRVQRIILDALGEAKNRHFRNTWDYLDWTVSQ